MATLGAFRGDGELLLPAVGAIPAMKGILAV
jgi:hypothetical protein